MQWFARGKLWSSPEEARAETARRAEAADAAARGRNWRPGGSHKDPRQPYKDAKKQRNQDRRQRRFEYRAKDDQAGGTNKDQGPKREWNKAAAPQPRESKPWSDRPKPAGRWPRDERQDRPGPKAGGWDKRPARPRDDRPAEARPPRYDRPAEARPPRTDRPVEARAPKKDWSGPPSTGRPPSAGRPPAEGRREFKPWNDRPKPAGRWPRDERQDRPGPKAGGWDKRPARPRDDRSTEARAPKKDWSGPPSAGRPPSEGRREFKPWNDRPKPPGRWPRDERQDRPGPKTGGWDKRPARPAGPRETRPWSKPRPQGGPPETDDRAEREPRKPWPNQGKPEQRDRPPFRGTHPPSNRPPAQSRFGDRPPFKGPRDSGSRGNGPRSKGPRGPKR
jgi:hypothetical protein